MINDKELLYVVDENNDSLLPEPRNVVHKNRLWHRTTGIWVVNNKKQILCQKRSLNKDIKPGFWTVYFGGHVAPSEEYIYNAVSEITEELGISVTKESFIPYKILKSDKPHHKEFQQVFVLVLDKEISELYFEKEEIDELRWIDLSEVRKILSDPKIENWVKKPWDDEVLTWLGSLQT